MSGPALYHPTMKLALFFTVFGLLAGTTLAQPLLKPTPPISLSGMPPTAPRTAKIFVADGKADQLQLIRGNGMLGQFLGFDPQRGLSWNHPDIKPDTLTIPTDRISRIDFAVKSVPANAKSHSGVIEFSNGDRLAGEVLGMENNKLRISTWYAGELAVDRSTIRTLSPGTITSSSLYSGPVTKKGWKETRTGTLGWNFSDGGFESTASGPVIGRSFPKMPTKARVEFDLEWKRGSPSVYVGFMTENLTSYSGGNCYSIRLTGSSVYVYRYAKVGGGIRSQRLQPSSRSYSFGIGPKKVRIALCHDTSKKKVAVIINGKLVGEWNDTMAAAPPLSNGLNFSSRTSNPMRISRITISEWSGNLPGAGNVAADAGAKEDFVLFANDDSITGKLQAIGNDVMKFKSTAFGDVNIPVGKVGTIHFARDTLVTPPTPANSVRATLAGNSRITGVIKAWKGNQVILGSPIFGEATFDANIFRRVEFNLGKPRSASTQPVPRPNWSTLAHQIRVQRNQGNIKVNEAKQLNGREIPPQILERLQELQGRQGAIPRKR